MHKTNDTFVLSQSFIFNYLTAKIDCCIYVYIVYSINVIICEWRYFNEW